LFSILLDVQCVCKSDSGSQNISAIIKKVDDYFKNKQEPDIPTLDLTLDEFIEYGSDTIDESDDNTDIRYFIKPIGSTDSPFPESGKLDKAIVSLHFAKRPRAVRIGDILICHAVGSTKFIGYYEVITEPILTGGDDDR